jgi:hypothetical protein
LSGPRINKPTTPISNISKKPMPVIGKPFKLD